MLGATEPEPDRLQEDTSSDREIAIELAVRLQRRGVETTLVVGDAPLRQAAPDPKLVAAVCDGWSLFAKLKDGEARSAQHLGELHGIHPGDVSRMLPLAFLAPDIVEAILEGRQPVGLTAARLKRIGGPPAFWAEQRRLLGFV